MGFQSQNPLLVQRVVRLEYTHVWNNVLLMPVTLYRFLYGICWLYNILCVGYVSNASSSPDCFVYPDGSDYRGQLSVTESGRSCQAWSSQKPHRHSLRAEAFPDNDLSLAANHCRNPNSRNRPWCYTTDPDVEWDYCKIGRCPYGIGIAVEIKWQCILVFCCCCWAGATLATFLHIRNTSPPPEKSICGCQTLN